MNCLKNTRRTNISMKNYSGIIVFIVYKFVLFYIGMLRTLPFTSKMVVRGIPPVLCTPWNTELGKQPETCLAKQTIHILIFIQVLSETFQSFFLITDIATYRLNQPWGQIIWNTYQGGKVEMGLPLQSFFQHKRDGHKTSYL